MRYLRPVMIVAAVVCVMVAACAPSVPPTAIVVYGDSLVVESADEIVRQVEQRWPGRTVMVRAYGGTAQCDFHDAMRTDVTTHRLEAVVIAFTGNHVTPCAVARPWPGYYASDADWATTHFRTHGVPLAFVAAPPVVGATVNQTATQYRNVAYSRGVTVVDTTPLFTTPATPSPQLPPSSTTTLPEVGQVVVDAGQPGTGALRVPCLPSETAAHGCANDNTIRVRHSDGLHLCSTTYRAGWSCATPTGGTRRYATAIVDAAQRARVPAR